MNVNYELLKVFYLVATNKSISNAAKFLGISQPAVTQSIKNLEKSLGGELFIRSKKGVQLTDEGKILYNYVEEGINFFNNGLKRFEEYQNLESGIIRVGADNIISKYLLMPYFKIFHEKYPAIDIQITNDRNENLLKLLRNGTLDLLLMPLPRKEIKNITTIGIKDIQDVFIANDRYYEETKKLNNLQELLELPIIVEKNPSTSRAYFELVLKSKNINCTPKMEVDNQELLIEFVKNGFGIGFATKEYIEKEKNINIIDVGQIPKRKVGIALNKKNKMSTSIKQFIELLKKQ